MTLTKSYCIQSWANIAQYRPWNLGENHHNFSFNGFKLVSLSYPDKQNVNLHYTNIKFEEQYR